jgi:uncharacterized repeat protein (TIGR01451 family)
MLGRITLIAVVALLGIHVALSTSAQQETIEPAGAPPTLGERLQRFRREILGDENARTREKTRPLVPRAARKGMPAGSPALAPSEPMVEGAPSEVGSVPRAEAPAPAPITFPPRMETQGARPARAGSVRGPAPVDPATRSMRAKMMPMRRGVEHTPAEVAEEQNSAEPEPAQPFAPQAPDDASAVPHAAPSHADENPPTEPEAAQQNTLAPQGTEPQDSLPQGVEPQQETEPQDALPRDTVTQDTVPQDTAATNEALPQRDEASDANVLFTAQSPVLNVEASGPRTVQVGKEASFLVKLRNSGAAANGVVVTIHVPNDADVASAEPTAGNARPASGSESRESLEWTIERLEADSEETLRLKLVPRKSSPLDLAVNWTFTPETSQTLVEVQEAKLAMGLSGPTDVLFGQTKVYKLSISNPGNGDAENVTVGLAPIGRAGEATGTYRLGRLKAGESKTVDIELTARQAGAITIKAHAFADGPLRAEAAEQVLVRRASLQVEVEAPRVKYAGTAGTYRVKVENAGDAAAENVQVSAVLPPQAKFASASGGGKHEPQEGRVTWNVGSLQPGAERVFELAAELHAAGDNRMQFTAAADGDLSAAATSSTRVEAIADLKLEVRDPQGPIPVGDEAMYEVRIHNRGTKAAENVDLATFFSEGLEPISADGGPHDIGPGQVVFQPIGAIGAGDTAVFHVRARADAAGNHVFRAEVVCASLDTKLASEEATHFYGERRRMAARDGEPHPAVPRDEPTPAQADRGEPTPAAPQESSGA